MSQKKERLSGGLFASLKKPNPTPPPPKKKERLSGGLFASLKKPKPKTESKKPKPPPAKKKERLSGGLFASLKKPKPPPPKKQERLSGGLFASLKKPKPTSKPKPKKLTKKNTFQYDRMSEHANVILPDQVSINSNIFLEKKQRPIGPTPNIHKQKQKKGIQMLYGDYQSVLFSKFEDDYSYFQEIISEKSDPVAKFLGGGFKQIKKVVSMEKTATGEKKKTVQMTIINFKTDIDKPDPERVISIYISFSDLFSWRTS